jgi:hypothetical protein
MKNKVAVKDRYIKNRTQTKASLDIMSFGPPVQAANN